jgi:hypothetical protein
LRLLIFFAYAALAVALTWPLALKGGAYLAGYQDRGDLQNTWYFYWCFWKLISIAWAHFWEAPGMFVRELIDIPYRLGVWNWGEFLITTLPFRILTGSAPAWNLQVFAILALNSFCGFLLMEKVCANKGIAFAAGLLLGCNPYSLWTISYGIPIFASVYPVYLFLFLFLKALDSTRGRDWFFAGLAWGVAGLVYWFSLPFLALAGLIILLHRRFSDGRTVHWRGLLPLVLGMLLIAMPFSAPFIPRAFSHPSLVGSGAPREFPPLELILLAGIPGESSIPPPGPISTMVRSIDLLSPVLPHSFFLYGLLVPALGGLVARRKGPWILLFSVFFVLALGPYLKFGGSYPLSSAGGIPLPYIALCRFAPLFARFQWPVNLMPYLLLSLGALASMYLASLPERRAIAFAVLLIVAGAVELFLRGAVPLPMARAEAPAYYEILRRELSDKGIIEASYDLNSSWSCYWQTFHGKKVLGTLFNFPPWLGEPDFATLFRRETLEENSFWRYLKALREGRVTSFAAADKEFFVSKGYGNVVVHRRTAGAVFIERELARHLGPPVFKDFDTTVFPLSAGKFPMGPP